MCACLDITSAKYCVWLLKVPHLGVRNYEDHNFGVMRDVTHITSEKFGPCAVRRAVEFLLLKTSFDVFSQSENGKKISVVEWNANETRMKCNAKKGEICKFGRDFRRRLVRTHHVGGGKTPK